MAYAHSFQNICMDFGSPEIDSPAYRPSIVWDYLHFEKDNKVSEIYSEYESKAYIIGNNTPIITLREPVIEISSSTEATPTPTEADPTPTEVDPKPTKAAPTPTEADPEDPTPTEEDRPLPSENSISCNVTVNNDVSDAYLPKIYETLGLIGALLLFVVLCMLLKYIYKFFRIFF